MKQIGAWHGGTVYSVALSPTFSQDGLMLAATGGGLFRSTDRGQEWRLCSNGFVDPVALCVLFAQSSQPDKAFILWAASPQGRLYRSTDNGLSWAEIESWGGLGIPHYLLCSPHYVSDQTLFCITEEGIFRTLDDGINWEEANFGLLDTEVLCMVCAPDFQTSSNMWAGTANGGLYRTRNAGLAWRESGSGLPDCAMQALVLSPNYGTDKTLFVGTDLDGVYVSSDGGQSWQMASEDLAGLGVQCLAALADPTAEVGYVLLAGSDAEIFRSLDGGASWEQADGGEMTVLELETTQDGRQIIAGTYRTGIFSSADGGANWQPLPGRIASHVPPIIQPLPQGGLMALDTDGAIAISQNGGETWREVEILDELLLPPIMDLVVTQDGAETVIFATEAGCIRRWRTKELVGSTPWRRLGWDEIRLPDGVDDRQGGLLALSPDFQGDGYLLWSDGWSEMALSVDGGDSWQALPTAWPDERLIHLTFMPDFSETSEIMVVTGGLNEEFNYDIRVHRLVLEDDTADFFDLLDSSVDAEDATFLLIGEHHADESSENQDPVDAFVDELADESDWLAGILWETAISFETEIFSVLLALPHDPVTRTFYLATRFRLMRFYFPDNWGEIEHQQLAVTQYFFDEAENITALAASPNFATDQTLYVSTTQGIYRSTDAGEEWECLTQAIPERPITSLFFSQSGDLRGVTLGGEVWHFDQSGVM